MQSKPPFKYYAGIGSRATPTNVKAKMTLIARQLSKSSFCLRSGGAQGADEAFEKGAVQKQIFLPWNGFNGRIVDNNQYAVPPENNSFVEKYHPNPKRLSDAGRKLMSRNSYQVLGPNLDDPVDFLICWTKDGKASGGTGQAIRIANDYGIPVFNLKNGFEDFSQFICMQLLLN